MKRRHVLAAGAAAALSLAAKVTAAPVQAVRPYRIFMILFRGETAVEKGFRDYLAAHDLAAELIVRNIEQDVTRIAALIAEARALRVELIYTWGTPVTLAVVGSVQQREDLKKSPAAWPALVTEIPVVFTMVSSPESAGLVVSRSAPGRNFTGAVHVVPLEQQLGAIRAYRPLKSLAVIYNPAELNSRRNVQELREAARRDHFELLEKPVPLDAAGQPLASELPQLVQQVAQARPSLLYFGPDTFLAANRKVFTEAAVAAGLPIFAATEIALREGKALFGLVSPYEKVGQLTAHKAIQILRDKIAPQAVEIETLGRFSYIVNMPVATDLVFYPPMKVVNYAEIIR